MRQSFSNTSHNLMRTSTIVETSICNTCGDAVGSLSVAPYRVSPDVSDEPVPEAPCDLQSCTCACIRRQANVITAEHSGHGGSHTPCILWLQRCTHNTAAHLRCGVILSTAAVIFSCRAAACQQSATSPHLLCGSFVQHQQLHLRRASEFGPCIIENRRVHRANILLMAASCSPSTHVHAITLTKACSWPPHACCVRALSLHTLILTCWAMFGSSPGRLWA